MSTEILSFEVAADAAIQDLDQIRKKVVIARDASTREYCGDIRDEAVVQLQENKTNDIGTLRRSIEVDEIPDGHRVVVGAPHGAVIEFGRRPAGIPIEVVLDNRAGLTAWVRRKMRPVPGGDDPDEQLKARRRISARSRAIRARTGLRGRGKLDFYENVAIAISKKKAVTKQEPKPFIQPAIAKLGGAAGLKEIAIRNLNNALS